MLRFNQLWWRKTQVSVFQKVEGFDVKDIHLLRVTEVSRGRILLEGPFGNLMIGLGSLKSENSLATCLQASVCHL